MMFIYILTLLFIKSSDILELSEFLGILNLRKGKDPLICWNIASSAGQLLQVSIARSNGLFDHDLSAKYVEPYLLRPP